MIAHGSVLWGFLSEQERILADDGAFLLEKCTQHTNEDPTDYSYIVFPYAKLYEGFLKDAFLALGIITRQDYKSNHFRIGKVLSPNLVRRLRNRSAYGQIRDRFGEELAQKLWYTWKEGRNLIFHYFPSEFRLLTRTQAAEIIQLLVTTMEEFVERTGVRREGN